MRLGRGRAVPAGQEVAAAAAAAVAAAVGPVAAGEASTILTTMANKRLLLASLAAAVEYQRRVTLNPRQKRSTAVKVLKVTATAVEVVGVQSDGSS